MGSGSFVTHKIVRREHTAKIGQEQAAYDVTVAVSVNAVYYDRNAVERTARTQMNTTLGAGKDLQALDRDSFAVKLKEQNVAQKKAVLDVTVNGTGVVSEHNEAFDRKKIAGLSLADAQGHLLAVDGVAQVNIRLSPSWIKRLPTLPDHITMVVN